MQPTHNLDVTTVFLALSLELCSANWKIAASDGRREKPALYKAALAEFAARIAEVCDLIERLKAKWKLPADCPVHVVYEAGQDGFSIARALQAKGIRVLVVDPASLPVARHARRAKTDRLDALMLINSLLGWLRGERGRMHVVRVPSVEAEAHRHVARDRGELQREIGAHRDRIRKLLRTEGVWVKEIDAGVKQRLQEGQLRGWDGQPVTLPLRERLTREFERLELAQAQFAALERNLLEQLPPPLQERVAQLARLKGVGWVGAMRLVLELYWRNFHNRRQVGACVGLVAQPYDSGTMRSDQGISKQGNRKVRALLIEMAWMWLRHQPASALAAWFKARTAATATNKRIKRIAVVAVARRLAIALWRYLETGVVPEGAVLKA